MIELTCAACGDTFEREYKKRPEVKGRKVAYCRKCSRPARLKVLDRVRMTDKAERDGKIRRGILMYRTRKLSAKLRIQAVKRVSLVVILQLLKLKIREPSGSDMKDRRKVNQVMLSEGWKRVRVKGGFVQFVDDREKSVK